MDENYRLLRTPSAKTKSPQGLRSIINATKKLWRQHHLTYDQTRYSPRRIQYLVKETAEQAQITKRVYPPLLRHSVATTLLERGMPIEQMQKCLGHAQLETTQSDAMRSGDTHSHRRLEPTRPQPQASRSGGGDHLWPNIT
jgi:integrase